MADDNDLTMPIIGLAINALLIPGLGTLIGGGRVRDGIIQLALILLLPASVFIAVATLTATQSPDASQAVFPFAIAVVIIAIGVWVWAVVSMALLIGRRSKGHAAVA